MRSMTAKRMIEAIKDDRDDNRILEMRRRGNFEVRTSDTQRSPEPEIQEPRGT